MHNLLEHSIYGYTQEEKQRWMQPILLDLIQWHQMHCPAYRHICEALTQFPGEGIEQAVPVHIQLFKSYLLRSVPQSQIIKKLYSSGTSGQPSIVLLDQHTASLQTKALVKIGQHWLGRQRLPMLIIDHMTTTQPRNSFNARAAGIKGLSFLGRDHCYALQENMELRLDAVMAFVEKYADQPLFIFGFTFVIWHYFLQYLARHNIKLPLHHAILLHSGGWKKLEAQKVSAQRFQFVCQQQLGLSRVHNFYGLVEQTGNIFMACEHGHLHCPVFADIIIRNPNTLEVQPVQQTGLIQLCSVLPQSYPGHLILTEDLGCLLGEDDCPCGRQGRYFLISGRRPQAEVRGCSEHIAQGIYADPI